MTPIVHTPAAADRPRAALRGRGFTLIEVMAGVALMAIFAQLVGSFTGWQLQQYTTTATNLVRDDAARGYISLLRDDIHQAGWGQAINANAYGWTPIGQCLPIDAWEVDVASEQNCTGRDENNNSDRMRIIYGRAREAYVQQASNPTTGPCLGSSQTVGVREADGFHTKLLLSQNDLILVDGYGSPGWACFFLSGDCVDGSDAPASNISFCLDGGNPWIHNSLGCEWVAYGNYDTRVGVPSIGCTNGWKAGWTLAYSDTINYTVRQDPSTGAFILFRRNNERDIVAVSNVSHFQITYGVDLSVPMDGKLDDCPSCGDDPYPALFGVTQSWCRNLGDNSLCNMQLSDGSNITRATLYNRIVAVHVSFQIIDPTLADGDPKKIKSYQATISLKNRAAT